MDKNSNAYTFIFAIIMVVIVAAVLAFTATTLKPFQELNVKNEKMQSILSTIGVDVDRDHASIHFDENVKQQLTLKPDGSVDESIDAFKINLQKEIKKDHENQRYPIYIAQKDGKTFYIIPLFGSGLWDSIWGYLALGEDKNTIVGASFAHAGETPGLGAEINQPWFGDQFIGKTIFDKDNNFVSVKTVKGGAKVDDMHGVDAISGGTITSDGVTKMIEERLEHYLSYLKNN